MRRLLAVAALSGALSAPAQAAATCKLALVLALDISSSVNSREYAIQLGGLADALRVPEVREAILQPRGTVVAALAFEWSGENQQALIADWTMLDSPTAIDAFADRLSAHRRTASSLPTALGQALAFAARQFDRAPPCARRTIDVSGDGENNDGPSPDAVRARGLLAGLTINGLVIQGAYPDPGIHYREQVMQGDGAFVALARDFGDYPAVIVGKLLQEMDQQMILGEMR